MIAEFIASHNVIISAAILLIAYVFIALEKIPKMTIALLGAVITIILFVEIKSVSFHSINTFLKFFIRTNN